MTFSFDLIVVTAVDHHVLEAAEMDRLQLRSLGIQVTVCGKSTGTWMSSPSLKRTSTKRILMLLGGQLKKLNTTGEARRSQLRVETVPNPSSNFMKPTFQSM